MAKSERYTIVRILGNNKPSTKVTDRWTFSTRQKAYDFVAEVEGGTKFHLTDAVKKEIADDAGEPYVTEKLDGGIVYLAHKGSDKVDDRERMEILARVGGQVSKSGTELIAVAGDLDKLMDLYHFATKMVSVDKQGQLVVATFALNPDAKRQRRNLVEVREATREEIAAYMMVEVFKSTDYAADELVKVAQDAEQTVIESIAV